MIRQDAMSADDWVVPKKTRRPEYGPKNKKFHFWEQPRAEGNMHYQFYQALQKSGGHLSLVAEELDLPLERVNNHCRDFKRELKKPGARLWGHPELRNIPSKTACSYCFKFNAGVCDAKSRGMAEFSTQTCSVAPLCDSCGRKGVCVDQDGRPTECQTRCRDCGKIGHSSKKSKACPVRFLYTCQTCGKTGCNQRICWQPRKKTSEANVRKLLETATVPVPADTAEAHSLAQSIVSEIAERDVLKSDENKIQKEILKKELAAETVSYTKRMDFLTYCLQSNDPALAPPASTLGYKNRAEQQRYYFELYKQLQEEYVQNPSVTNAYTSFMQQWRKEDDGERGMRQAVQAAQNHKYKVKDELRTMRRQSRRVPDQQLPSKEYEYHVAKRTLQEVTKLSAEPTVPLTTKMALEGMPNKTEEETKQKPNDMVKIWNGFIPMAEQLAPKGETAEQRKQREDETYMHKRMHYEEQKLNNSYNPKMAQSWEQGIDLERPYTVAKAQVFAKSPIKPPKPKPEKAVSWSFELIKKRRLQRERNGVRWIKDRIMMEQGHFIGNHLMPAKREFEAVKIEPKRIEKTKARYSAQFRKEQAVHDKITEYEQKQVVHTTVKKLS